MKNILLTVLVLLGMAATMSCEDEPQNTFALGELFELPFGESRQLAEDELTITFSDVLEDSRCPQGVQCIWQGQIRVELTLNDSQNVLLTGQGDDPALDKDTIDNYIFSLLEVRPYPTANNTIAQADYLLKLQVDSL